MVRWQQHINLLSRENICTALNVDIMTKTKLSFTSCGTPLNSGNNEAISTQDTLSPLVVQDTLASGYDL